MVSFFIILTNIQVDQHIASSFNEFAKYIYKKAYERPEWGCMIYNDFDYDEPVKEYYDNVYMSQ